MSNDDSGQLIYGSYADFLQADPRRRGDALELGIDWRDGESYYRACWYRATGEVTLERLTSPHDLDVEDFHQGISGSVEVLRRIPRQEELTRLIGPWPHIARGQPRTVQRLRALLGAPHLHEIRDGPHGD